MNTECNLKEQQSLIGKIVVFKLVLNIIDKNWNHQLCARN